jgi:hypothetical protein
LARYVTKEDQVERKRERKRLTHSLSLSFSLSHTHRYNAFRCAYWCYKAAREKPYTGLMVPYTNFKTLEELDVEFYDVLEEKLFPLVPVKSSERPKHLQDKARRRNFDARRLHANDINTVKYWVERWTDDSGDLGHWGSDQSGEEDEDAPPPPLHRSNKRRKKHKN